MFRILSFVLAASLFINIVFFAKWREIRKMPGLIGERGATKFGSNPYELKIIEPVAVTQSIGNLQKLWWNEALAKRTLKNIVDKDFPEESPILI